MEAIATIAIIYTVKLISWKKTARLTLSRTSDFGEVQAERKD